MIEMPVAAVRIKRELAELEQTLNVAMAQAAAITQSCALARNAPGVSSTAGHSVFLRLASLTNHLTQGAGDAARVHAGLRDLGRELNRDNETMMPDQNGCPVFKGQAMEAAA